MTEREELDERVQARLGAMLWTIIQLEIRVEQLTHALAEARRKAGT